ncbi:MAG: hypothetical protein BWY95_01381 [Bacteroidetes bacterium ADurb.BinA104]|nr:MAG: hypothetical protein BWY95_01381 [Bacteroidetes bacterium ADurb.BinA104]
MLHGTLVECDGPVGIVFPHRCVDVKALGKLHVDAHLATDIQLFGKWFFHRGRVEDHVIVQVFICRYCVHTELTFQSRFREDLRTEAIVELVVSDMLDDHCRLLLVDQVGAFENKLLWIEHELVEHRFLDTGQDTYHRIAGQSGLSHHLANKVVLHVAVYCRVYINMTRRLLLETLTYF